MGIPIREASYQPPGVLVLSFPHSGVSNYLRSLNLSNATVNVHYDYQGVTYNRDIFASAPGNKVILLNFTASKPASISFSCNFSTPQTATYSTIGNDLIMHASVSTNADSRYYASGLTNRVNYDAHVRLVASGGTVTASAGSLAVTNADSVTLILGVASNVKTYNDITADYVTACSNNVTGAAALGYTALRQAQQADYQTLFNRVVLDLGTNTATTQPIGVRKRQMALNGNDPQLVTLDFQLGRYLMIAGSRPGSQALNLQGKWNDTPGPSWDSKMTLNINEEMNYWGAEVCNLSECTLPLFDMMQDLAVTGHNVAQSNYFSGGWVVHHNTDLWRDAAPCNGNDGIWPTGAAWLCQHVWWHYLYTGDTNWLANTGYPLMKGAALFFQGFLVTHPAYGWKVTCPSYSPEHDEGPPYNAANIPSPTMDNELCRDLFNHVIAATRILGIDSSFATNIAALSDQLPPEQVGTNGQLQEWLEDVDGSGYDAGHRHCSHLVGFFPGDEISPYYTPATASAAKTSVYLRGYANSGLTPWSCSWRVNLRDRLLDGDGAWTNLLFLYGYNKVATNLIFADNNRQLDSIFGRLSGIAEMFLQSQSGEVSLLPALPSQLTNGFVSGLCARGGFEVDNLSWTNGHLTGATILSKCGNVCRLRVKNPVNVLLGTTPVTAPMVLPGLYQFSTVAGSNYTIVPAAVAETENLAAAFSAGDSHRIVTNAAFSGWRGTQLSANAAGDYVTYTVPNVSAGTYHIVIAADAAANRGQFQLAVGPSGGTLTNIGPVQDTWSPTNLAYLLPIRLTTPTNVISLWTNMLQEFDCGTWNAPSNGNYGFRFSVAGKNSSSFGYNLVLDYIKFAPAPAQQLLNLPPNAPTNVAPPSGSVGQSPTLALRTSPFSDPNVTNSQAATQWLIYRADNSLLFDSGSDSNDLTNLSAPPGLLDFGSTYSWQARYRDSQGLWSAYSTSTAFSTVAPSLAWSLQPGQLLISFATNSTGFSLEYSTNLDSPDWLPVSGPLPVVGPNYVRTNNLVASPMFFRLRKP
jgi:alpha-L-fucosidase 2